MPGKKAHFITTLIISPLTGLVIYNNIFYIIIFSLLALITTGLPDRIERPTNSLHRKFFHSITFFTILTISLTLAINNPLSGLIFGYLSHLLLDYARTTHKPLV